MKARSVKVGDEQWARWGEAAAEVGLDRSTFIRQAVDGYVSQGVAPPPAVQVKSTLPGMGRHRYACSECGNLNVQGRCMQHPAAKQKILEGA